MPVQARLISFRFNEDGCSHSASFPLWPRPKSECAVCRQHSASGLFIPGQAHRLNTLACLQINSGFMGQT
jgi:hypothetical protein